MKCNHKRIKKINTHGEKSRGYLVCKDCNKVVKKEELKNDKRR